jgi:2-methylcitrate dehydratase PrpD
MSADTTTKALSAFVAGPISVGDAEWRWATAMLAGTLAAVKNKGAGDLADVKGAAERLGGECAEATIWTGGEARQTEWAAFVNAYAAHQATPADDNTPEGMAVGSVIGPAAVAVGELVGASAAQVVEAALVGAEVAIRVADALGPTHRDRGWHLLGTAGVVGTAAAASRLLSLSADQTEEALGLAATQAAGLQAHAGTKAHGLHPAKACLNGIEAARLVKAGLDGPRNILEGRRGLFALASDGPDASRVHDRLGDDWRVLASSAWSGDSSERSGIESQLGDRQAAASSTVLEMVSRA